MGRMAMKNWKHQEDAFQKLKNKEYGALLMEVGCGKSRTAIQLLEDKYRNGEINAVMLVVPSGLRWQWHEQQLPMHAEEPYQSVVWQSSKAKTKKATDERREKLWESGGLPWLIVNVEAFSTRSHMEIFQTYVERHKCAIVVDESTKLKSSKANRTINLMHLSMLAKAKLILTGTPVTNSPLDLYSQFRFLDHNFWGGMSFFGFRNRYAIHRTADNPFGGKYQSPLKPHEIRMIRAQVESGNDIHQIAAYRGMQAQDVRYIADHPELMSPYRHMGELKDIINSVSVVVLKEDVLNDLPDRTYNKIDIEMSPQQRNIYNKLKKDMLAEHKGEVLSVPNKLALLIRLQQVACGWFPYEDSEQPMQIAGKNPKIQAILEELEDAPSQVVIWSRFITEIVGIRKAIEEFLPYRSVATYYGAVNIEDRAERINRFQNGELEILIANPATAGHGLNLQCCHHAIYASNDFSLEHRLQSEGRLHRAGQKNAVTYTDMVMRGTVDEQIHKALIEKHNVSDFFAGRTLAESFGAV